MSKLAAFVANLGENPRWIAFNAHLWFGYAYVLSGSIIFEHPLAWMFSAVMLAVYKEYWFDMRDEVMPKQTFADSTEDFAGYGAGIALAGIMLASYGQLTG